MFLRLHISSLHSEKPAYRFGFNGKEKDQDGEFGLTAYDYGFRIYNPGIARFLSVDPLTASYPWYSPYQFAGNNPIWAIDLDGLEEKIMVDEQPKSEASLNLKFSEDIMRSVAQYSNAKKQLIDKVLAEHDVNRLYVSKEIENRVIILPTDKATYVIPKTEEGFKISAFIKKSRKTMGHITTAVELYEDYKPGIISPKNLKRLKNANKLMNPIEIIKVHPVVEVVLNVLEPLETGEGASTTNIEKSEAALATQITLDKLFGLEVEQKKDKYNFERELENTRTEKQDATRVARNKHD